METTIEMLTRVTREGAPPNPGTAARNQLPQSTKVSSALMQDLVSGEGLSVADGANKVALFADPYRAGLEEGLVINASGGLTHVRRGDDGTGWEQTELPSPAGPLSEVVVAIAYDGSVWAMVVDANANMTGFKLQADGTWVVQPQLALAGWLNLHVGYLPGALPIPIVYATDPSQKVLNILNSGIAEWYPTSSEQLPDALTDFTLSAFGFASSSYFLTSSTADIYYARPDGDFTLRLQFDGVGNLWRVTYKGAILPAQPGERVIGAFPHPLGIGPICLQVDGSLMYSWPIRSNHETGSCTVAAGFSTAWPWVDRDGMTHVYGITGDGMLAVVRQTAWQRLPDGGISPVFFQATLPNGQSVGLAVPVATGVVSVALDPYPDLVPNLLVKFSGPAASDAYSFYAQDHSTYEWSIEQVRLAPDATGQQPVLVDRYVSNVTVLDGFGSPVANSAVTVSADTLTEVYATGTSYLIGPRNSAELTTDAMGKVTLGISARGLTTPTLMVNAEGLDGGATVRPASGIHSFLGGTSGLPGRPYLLTADMLEKATVDGQPLVPSWQSMPAPGDVVTSLTDIFAAANGKTPASRAVAGFEGVREIVGFSIQTWDVARPHYRAFVDHEDLESWAGAVAGHPQYGGVLDNAGQWLADLWESIRCAAANVWEITVNFTNGVAKIAIQIGDAVYNFVTQILPGAFDEAAHVVEALFQQLKAGVDRLVDWLKAIFDLTAIWDTKTAIEQVMGISLTYTSTVLDYFVKKMAGDWFDQQRGAITGMFELAKSYLSGTTVGQFQDISKANLPGPAGALATTPTAGKDSPQVTWLYNQMLSSSAMARGIPFDVKVDGVGDIWTAFWNTITQCPAWTSLQKAGDDFGQLVGNLLNPSDSSGVDNTNLVLLLDMTEQLCITVLDLLECLLDAIVNAIEAGFAALDSVLKTPEDDNMILSGIYTWIQSQAYPGSEPEKATLGGIASLLIAFPITVMYKLAAGADATLFPKGSIPTPPPFNPSAFGTAAMTADPAAWPPFSLSVAMQLLQGLGQMGYGIFDAITDLAKFSGKIDKVASVYNIVLITGLGFPMWTTAIPTQSSGTYYDGWCCLMGSWAFQSTQNILDIVCAFGEGTLVKNFLGQKVTIVNTILGLGAMITACLGASKTSNDQYVKNLGIVDGFFSNFSAVTQPVRMVPLESAWGPMVWGVKAIVDGACGVIAGFVCLPGPFIETFGRASIASDQAATFNLNQAGNYPLGASGGLGSLTWTSADLPAWLSLDPGSGTLSGTPPPGTPASTVIHVTVTDAFTPPQSASAPVTVNVS